MIEGEKGSSIRRDDLRALPPPLSEALSIALFRTDRLLEAARLPTSCTTVASPGIAAEFARYGLGE